eukprot:2422573-Amphidinium_carterae.1
MLHLLTYLKNTSVLGLKYEVCSKKQPDIHAHHDVSFPPQACCSYGGQLCCWQNGKNAILFKSSKQSLVIASRAESEFVKFASLFQDVHNIECLLVRTEVVPKSTVLYCDNQASNNRYDLVRECHPVAQ